ncbi:MAG: protein-export chaperone SecB [Rickettsiales bacterium]|nr:protein-export chaperone SecB [Rickettsiales bacterium]
MKETVNQNNQPQVVINTQYVKDLSFESPEAPACFMEIKTAPKIDLALDIKVQDLQKESYEIVLKIDAKALLNEKTLFMVELEYAGLFSIKNIDKDDQKEQILLIYCPSLIFPFARRVIADVTRDGGFQPLMVNPIDFAALYMQQKQKQGDQSTNANKK